MWQGRGPLLRPSPQYMPILWGLRRHLGLPWWLSDKESACNAVDPVQSLGQSLEKGMATNFSILAWRIPRTEELGGLQSMGSQRVRHD